MMLEKSVKELEIQATKIRKRTWEMIYKAGSGHTGGDFSATDILTALYFNILNIDVDNPNHTDRDIYIQSKGHVAEVLWTTLALKGFFEESILDTYYELESPIIGHPTNKMPGVEMNTGSLGHGLAISVGAALASKIDNKNNSIYTLLGDGELAEGSSWEAAMAASHYKLSNLFAIIDRNKLQITGTTTEVLSTEPLKEKWEAFGWHVVEVDGHDINQLVQELSANESDDKPKMIIADTVKGKGISFVENQVSWHHATPSEEQFEKGLEELCNKLEELENE